MRRPPEVILFMVLVAAFGTAMGSSGLAAQWGMEPETGLQEDINDSEQDLKKRNYKANREEGEVNFVGSIFAGIDKAIGTLVMVHELQEMFINIGVPPWIATLFSSPVFLMFGMFMIYLISGRRMTVR